MFCSIIATPGRFLHVIMEMDLKLSSVEYVVFDEADRFSITNSTLNLNSFVIQNVFVC